MTDVFGVLDVAEFRTTLWRIATFRNFALFVRQKDIWMGSTIVQQDSGGRRGHEGASRKMVYKLTLE